MTRLASPLSESGLPDPDRDAHSEDGRGADESRPSFSLTPPKQYRSPRRRLGWMVALAVVGGSTFGAYKYWPALTGISPQERAKGWLTQKVGRERLLISVTEDGHVESASNVEVKCEVTGGSTILWIVQDGKRVEKGEVIVRLDQAVIEDQLNAQKILYEKALATKIQAEQTYEASKIAVEEYVNGTFVSEFQTLQTNVTISEENLRSTQNILDHTQRMFRKGFVTALQLEADKFAVKRAQLELDTAETLRDSLQKFTKPKMTKELEAARDAAQALMRSEQAACDLEKARLDKLQKQMALCVITAPQAGMVIYANEEGRRGNSDVQIEEGTVVREDQAIIRLPDLARMQVDVKVHESKIDQIRPGAPARITIQGREYEGQVVSVANQPEQKSWFSSDVKEYQALVAVDGDTKKIRPGMTAEVEIFIADLRDELTVPVSAVVEQRGRYFVWALAPEGPERRPVVLGPTNDKVIAVRDGVTEGEEVFLNPRAVIDEARDDAGAPGATKNIPDGIPNQLEAPKDPKTPGEQDPSASPFPTLGVLDTDGDSRVSRDEAPERMKQNFDRADTNGDGYIDAGEFLALRQRVARMQQAGGQPGAGSPMNPAGTQPGAQQPGTQATTEPVGGSVAE